MSRFWIGVSGALAMAAVCVLGLARSAVAEPVVPGTGQRLAQVGDDFEDPAWVYYPNHPKSSDEQDHRVRLPGGGSKNGRWSESALRGQPDVVKRVATPAGGLPGSQGSLLLATLYSGIPGSLSGQNRQDDFLGNVSTRIGAISVARSPSVVVRVFLPPWEQWEPRRGISFGFRTALRTQGRGKTEPYWPGIFFQYQGPTSSKDKQPSALVVMRANSNGQDVPGPTVTETGWWTLGISHTPDGQVHYYARPGVEELAAENRIGSFYPYGFRARDFQLFFFDLVNLDNGRSWSTQWIVDDPTVYVGDRVQAAGRGPSGRR